MDENELKLELDKARLDAEARKAEARSKVRQVIYGTMIVGLAAAAFPFAQKVAESVFLERIEQIRTAAELEKAQKQHDLEIEKQKALFSEQRRAFLQSLAEEARSEDINKRIRLADFYAHLATEEEIEKWEKFRKFLVTQREEEIRKQTEFAAVVDNPDASREEKIEATTRIASIESYLNPVDTSQMQQIAEQDCDFPRTGIPAADVIEDDLIAEVPLCSTPNKGGMIEPEFVVISFTAGATLDRAVENYMNDSARASAHILIGRDGSTVQMGRFTERLWHAGQSSYGGRTGFNNFSIGVELVNSGVLTGPADDLRNWSGESVSGDDAITGEHKYEPGVSRQWETYPDAQIEATIRVLRRIIQTYDIPPGNVVGKEDIARGRRFSPGPAFPWDRVRNALL